MGNCYRCTSKASTKTDIPATRGFSKRNLSQQPAEKTLGRASSKRLSQFHGIAKAESIQGVPLDVQMKWDDFSFIVHALQRVLPSIRLETLRAVKKSIQLLSVSKQCLLFQENEFASSLFVLKSGKAESRISGQIQDYYGEGDVIGLDACIPNSTRINTVQAVSDLVIYQLNYPRIAREIEQKSVVTFQYKTELLGQFDFFKTLTQPQKEVLYEGAVFRNVDEDEVLLAEGEVPQALQIIASGEAARLLSDGGLDRLVPGDSLADHHFLYSYPVTWTVRSRTVLLLLELERSVLAKALGSDLTDVIAHCAIKKSFANSQSFSFLFPEQVQMIASHTQAVHMAAGEVVVHAGTPKNEQVWVIVSGQVGGYTSPSLLGDTYVDSQDTYTEDICVKTDSVVCKIMIETIETVLHNALSVIHCQNKLVKLLRNVSIFQQMGLTPLRNLVQQLKTKVFSKGEVIFQSGSKESVLYLIREGSVEVLQQTKVIRILGENDYFGERALVFDKPRTATVRAITTTTCLMLDKAAVLSITDRHMANELMSRLCLQEENLTLSSMQPVRVLAKSEIANVLQVVYGRQHYALKAISKATAQARAFCRSVQNERHVLITLTHPMILKFVSTFRDSKRVYFLTEYAAGCRLADILKNKYRLSSPEVQFLGSCLILALDYLQSKGVMHRDIKPESVLIDSVGYPKLIGFGVSCMKPGRTYSIVGTPHFMAPEIVGGQGYSFACDLWALGVSLYECVHGYLPFGHTLTNPALIYQQALTSPLQFDIDRISRPMKQFLSKLLSRNPADRSCASALRSHFLFSNTDWQGLLTRQTNSPLCIPLVPKLEPTEQSVDQVLAELETKDNDSSLPMDALGACWDREF